MPVRRCEDVLVPMVERAIEKHSMGEEIFYTVALGPSPRGPGLSVAVFLRGVVLGTSLQVATTFVNPFGWTDESVDEVIRQMLGALLSARSDQTKQEAAPISPMATPGMGAPPQRLVGPNGNGPH
jgi:hypothetical protein